MLCSHFKSSWSYSVAMPQLKKKTAGNEIALVVKPQARWGRHRSCELWRTGCEVPQGVSLQQGCSDTTLLLLLPWGHHVLVRVSVIAHTRAGPWFSDNVVPLRVRGDSWMRQAGIPQPAWTASARSVHPASARSSLHSPRTRLFPVLEEQ